MVLFIQSAGPPLKVAGVAQKSFNLSLCRCSVDFSGWRRPHDGTLLATVVQSLKPKPVLFARRQLDLPFAVLLMRSAYEVVDELDVIAMDQFQKRFFERRQEAWAHYIVDCGNSVKQGVLTDPRYFDFISYAQFVTITDVFSEPETLFVEAFNAQGETRVVRRDPTMLPTSEAVLSAFQRSLGDRLFAKVFESSSRFLPPLNFATSGTPCPFEDVLNGMREVLAYFFFAGYCLKEPVVSLVDENTHTVSVELIGCCTLWGQRSLSRLAAVRNDYDVLAVLSLLKGLGWAIDGDVKSSYTESSTLRSYVLHPVT